MARRYCVVPTHWTEEEIKNSSCRAGTHFHATAREVFGDRAVPGDRTGKKGNGLVGCGLADWWIWPRLLRLTRTLPVRGLSARVGWRLAVAVARGEEWAKVALSEIQRKARREFQAVGVAG